MTPLRPLIVAPWGERLGGAEEMLWTFLTHCDRERVEPAVVFLADGPLVGAVGRLGMPAAAIPAGRLRHPGDLLRTVRRLGALLRRRRPDLLLSWSAKAHLYAGPAALLGGTGTQALWWQHALPDRHWVDRAATTLPAAAIGCSSEAIRVAQGSLRPRRRAFVVHPGIDLGAPPGADPGLRERLGIPAGRTVLGIVGRLQPLKGQDRFLAALADLRRRGREVHGLVVGGDAWDLSPDYAAGLRRLIGELDLADSVTMTGQVEDAAPYFALMDVAVSASVGEAFGIVLIEAMAAGVPVVAVAQGGPLEIVEPDVNGVLAADGSAAALATAIDRLLVEPQLRTRVAAAAARDCRARFGAEAMAAGLTERLVEIAGADPAPTPAARPIEIARG